MTYDHKISLATIGVLAETFPQCFSVFEKRRRPLKLDIHRDLLAALDGAITEKECAAAMRTYCSNACYLMASTEGAPRIDLNGNVAGSVSAEEAANAKQRLAQRHDRQARRREALAKVKAQAETEARNDGRLSLADLRAAARARLQAALTASK